MMMLEPCDVVLVQGRGWLSSAIRFFTRSRGESRTKISHVALVIARGGLGAPQIIEARRTVRRSTLDEYFGTGERVAVYRPRGLLHSQRARVVTRALGYEFKPYGYLEAAAHALDWCIGGAFFFRRLVGSDRYPICSWLVAFSFDEIGVRFGVPPGAASPDDIWDWVTRPDGDWYCVLELQPLR